MSESKNKEKEMDSELNSILQQQVKTAEMDEILKYLLAKTLFDKDKINMITDLRESHLSGLTKLFVINQCYMKEYSKGKTILDDLILYIKEIRISLNRLGRKELIDAFTKVETQQEIQKKGILDRFRG